MQVARKAKTDTRPKIETNAAVSVSYHQVKPCKPNTLPISIEQKQEPKMTGTLTDQDFAKFIADTKKVVLGAIQKHLAARFSYAIDDVVQETYIRAYNSLKEDKIRDKDKLRSWLYVTAKNECYRMNSKLNKEEIKGEKLISQKAPTMTGDNPTEKSALHNMEQQFILRQIAKLPDKYREVIELYSEGLAVKEIAERLSLRPGTVKSRTSRGMNILRSLVKEQGH